jgi:serine/threonine protein phosphatase PrpC
VAAPLKDELRQDVDGLHTARRTLESNAPGSAPWKAAVRDARRALDAFEVFERDARSTKLIVQLVPRRLLNRGVKEANRLRRLAPDELIAPPVAAGAPLSARRTSSVDDIRVPADETVSPIIAGFSRPGFGNQRNEDRVAAQVDPVSGTVTIVVGDGLAGRRDSHLAAGAAVEAGVSELTRPGAGPRTSEEAHRAAATAAQTRVGNLAVAGEYNPPSTTYTAVQVSGSWIASSNVGNTLAVFVGVDGLVMVLTGDDTVAKGRTHTPYFGEDSARSTLHFREVQISAPGVLIVVTDGFYNYVDTTALARVVRRADLDRLDLLVDAFKEEIWTHRGGRDDHTIVITRVGPERGAPQQPEGPAPEASALGLLPVSLFGQVDGLLAEVLQYAAQGVLVVVAALLLAKLLAGSVARVLGWFTRSGWHALLHAALRGFVTAVRAGLVVAAAVVVLAAPAAAVTDGVVPDRPVTGQAGDLGQPVQSDALERIVRTFADVVPTVLPYVVVAIGVIWTVIKAYRVMANTADRPNHGMFGRFPRERWPLLNEMRRGVHRDIERGAPYRPGEPLPHRAWWAARLGPLYAGEVAPLVQEGTLTSARASLEQALAALDAQIGLLTEHPAPGRRGESELRRLHAERDALRIQIEGLSNDWRDAFRVEGWQSLPKDVRDGFTRAYAMIVDSGPGVWLRRGRGAVDVTLLPDDVFDATWPDEAPGVFAPRHAGSMGSMRERLVLRQSVFAVSGNDAFASYAVIEAAAILLHQWLHVVDPMPDIIAQERNAAWISDLFTTVERLRWWLRLVEGPAERGPAGDRVLAGQRAVVEFFDALVREWRPEHHVIPASTPVQGAVGRARRRCLARPRPRSGSPQRVGCPRSARRRGFGRLDEHARWAHLGNVGNVVDTVVGAPRCRGRHGAGAGGRERSGAGRADTGSWRCGWWRWRSTRWCSEGRERPGPTGPTELHPRLPSSNGCPPSRGTTPT